NALALAAGATLLASCVSLTELPRALTMRDGEIRVQTLPCSGQTTSSAQGSDAGMRALAPQSIRVLTWNIHKEDDEGWQRDIATCVRDNDIVLLQEVVLHEPLRSVIEGSGLQWVMASSFLYRGNDIGVLTATRISPYVNCTQRAVEPLLRIPKSAVLSW